MSSPISPDEFQPISGRTGVRAVPRRFVLRLVHGDLTRRRADCLVVNRYLGVPVSGAAKAVDQYMGGALEGFAERSGFNEQAGSINFLPAKYSPFSADVVAVIAMGEYERFVVADENAFAAKQWIEQQVHLFGRNLAAACTQVDLRDVASTVHGAGPNSQVDPVTAAHHFVAGYLQGLEEFAEPGQTYFLTLVELEESKIDRFRQGIEDAIDCGDCPTLIAAGAQESGVIGVSEPWAWVADLDVVPETPKPIGIPKHLRLGALLQSSGSLKISIIGTSSADQAIFDEYPRELLQEIRDSLELTEARALRDLIGLENLLEDATPEVRQEVEFQIAATHNEAKARVARYGERLFQEVFGDENALGIRQRLLAKDASTLLLRLDEATASVPWELMAVDGRLLALERSMGRQLELVGQVRQPPQRLPGQSRQLKVLIVANPTQDLPQVEEESRRIIDALYSLEDTEIQVTALFGEEAMSQYVVPLLNEQFDVFHYAGHAYFDPLTPSKSGLILAGNSVFTAEKMWELSTPPRLVFFNACDSAATFESNQTPDIGPEGQYVIELPLGAISALLRAGTQNFIGTTWPVEDTIAAEMAIACYASLADGKTVGESLRLARLETIRRQGFGHLSWASYVLYGSPWNQPLLT